MAWNCDNMDVIDLSGTHEEHAALCKAIEEDRQVYILPAKDAAMDIEEFRIHGKEMVDFVADYWRDMRKREPLPNVKPGYMSNVIPRRLPSKTDDWKTIFDSLEEVVLKEAQEVASSKHIECWAANDWRKLEKAITLLSDSTYLAARGDLAHYSVEKVAAFCGVKFRKLRTILDPILKNYSVTKETLETAIREDRARGLIPFFMLATLGTTATCAVDSLRELGPICNREFIYLHADAAYGGGFLVCPEFRYLSNGIEYADSFNFNGHKEFQALFFSPMWFKDGVTAMKYFKIGNEVSEEWEETPAAIQHLRVPSGRRANALKIYFVLRSLGFEYIQSELRKHVQLAALFARLITDDDDFELFVPQHLGLVCFRIKNGTNAENKALCQAINDDRRIHLVPGEVHGVYFLRFAVCSPLTTEDDVRFAYNICKELLAKLNINDIFP
ncbi:pyridoxal-dependent decarboxylase domain protein, partial [Teladorsagia circumcincta]